MELIGAGRNESLSRAFDVLGAIAQARGATVRTAEIVARTDLPRSTVLRILGSLYELGAVSRSSDRSWTIGPVIAHLADASSPIIRLRDLVHEELVRITDAVQETSMIGIAVGDAAVRILDEVEGPQLLGVRSRWSERVIEYSASGFVRTLLAESPPQVVRAHLEKMTHPPRTAHTLTSIEDIMEAVDTIRRDGHSAVINELEDGIAGVGLPIRDGDKLIAQFAVYLPTVRLDEHKHQQILTELRRSAAVIASAATSL